MQMEVTCNHFVFILFFLSKEFWFLIVEMKSSYKHLLFGMFIDPLRNQICTFVLGYPTYLRLGDDIGLAFELVDITFKH